MNLTPEQWFVLPFFGHFALVVLLYAWLTVLRQAAVMRREVKVGDFVRAGADPDRSHRVARNLSNQFEAPMFALFAALFLYLTHAVTVVDIVAAWVFLGGRLLHTGVQTLTTNVPLRGVVFTLNFVAVMVLVGRVAVEILVPAFV